MAKNACPKCGHVNEPDFMICEGCEAPLPGGIPQTQSGRTSKVYKVITQKDKWFGGRFSPESLEKLMNTYASQGWRVIAVTTARFPALGCVDISA